MPEKFPKVGIVYLSYHSEAYWDDVVASLRSMTYPKEHVEFIIVDNPHPEFGSSASYIKEKVVPLSGADLPHITLLAQDHNTGYAQGNNIGIEQALRMDCEYIVLHNDDGFMDAACIQTLVAAAQADPRLAVVQSLILLYPQTDTVNSSGNRYHYLGFGGTSDYGLPTAQLQLPPVKDISYASFALVLLRADILKQVGLLDEDMFMYHEDLEYSLRVKFAGHRVAIARDAVFYHKYQFSRSDTKFYYMERNRYATLLMYYRWPTLLLLVPIGIIMEFGLLFFFVQQGWLAQRARVYAYWLHRTNWALWLRKRGRIQQLRTMSDAQFLSNAVSTVQFGEKQINSPLVRYVANPLLAIYWAIIKIFIIW